MKLVKKSFNLDSDLAQRLDNFIDSNPGLSLTMIMTQALSGWLKQPTLSIVLPKNHTEADVDALIEANQDLMNDLAK